MFAKIKMRIAQKFSEKINIKLVTDVIMVFPHKFLFVSFVNKNRQKKNLHHITAKNRATENLIIIVFFLVLKFFHRLLEKSTKWPQNSCLPGYEKFTCQSKSWFQRLSQLFCIFVFFLLGNISPISLILK